MNKDTGWNVIADLGNTEVRLLQGMLKLQAALGRIGDEETLSWVKKELRGYQPEEDPPKYRQTGSFTTGTFTDGHWEFKRPLVLATFMEPEDARRLEKPYLREGVGGLEDLAKKATTTLELAAGREILVKYGDRLNSMIQAKTAFGMRPVQCTQVRVEITGTAPIEALNSIRSIALELATNLEREVPEVMREDGVAAMKALRERGVATVRESLNKAWNAAIVEGVAAVAKVVTNG